MAQRSSISSGVSSYARLTRSESRRSSLTASVGRTLADLALLTDGGRQVDRQPFDFQALQVEYLARFADDLDLVERPRVVAVEDDVLVEVLAPTGDESPAAVVGGG